MQRLKSSLLICGVIAVVTVAASGCSQAPETDVTSGATTPKPPTSASTAPGASNAAPGVMAGADLSSIPPDTQKEMQRQAAERAKEERANAPK